jgi:hypothetical protein
MSNQALANQHGTVLVVALLILLVLTLIGLGSIFSSTFETKIAGNERFGNSAFYASKGGAQVGINRLPTVDPYSGDFGQEASYRSGKMTDKDPRPSAEMGLMPVPGYEASWQFSRFQINATGQSFGAMKEVEVQVCYGPFNTHYNN